jgi:hypothetical protein
MGEEEIEFQRGDELATAGDRVALEYGWWANEWLGEEAARSKADASSRAAFSYALTVLEGRHGRYLSRAQITDRIRIGRAFPSDKYKDLQAEFPNYRLTFSILRAAFVKDDEPATMENLLWAAENDASPLEINAHKVGGQVETDEAKAWRHLVEWAAKYLDRCEEENGRCGIARAVVDFDIKERNDQAL